MPEPSTPPQPSRPGDQDRSPVANESPDRPGGYEHVSVKQALITGVVALFPLVVTLVVLKLSWTAIDKISKPVRHVVNAVVTLVTGHPEPSQWIGTLVSLVLAVAVVYVLGVLIAGLFGRRLVAWADRCLGRLPIVRYIYPHARQLSEFLFGNRNVKFKRVVLVEYPRKGCYSLGFATSKGIDSVSQKLGRRMVAVFVPTSPTPFTGWTILVDENEVLSLDVPVDEAVRFAVSCGVIVPGEEPPKGLASSYGLPQGTDAKA